MGWFASCSSISLCIRDESLCAMQAKRHVIREHALLLHEERIERTSHMVA